MSTLRFGQFGFVCASAVAAALLASAACGGDDPEAADAAGTVYDAAIVDASVPDALPPDAEVDARIFPITLEETGLYSDFAAETLAAGVQEFTPTYPLWSDGAVKRRWVLLPDGATIDTTDMNFWVLPVGTKLWKEFSTPEGLRLETRYLWKMGPLASDWYFVSFAWNADTTEAIAVPQGVVDALGTTFDIPRERDCRTCHERMPDFALGFSAVQLAHQNSGVNLDTLVAASTLTVAPTGDSPYFPVPGTSEEQAVLGYLHSNCGGCHQEHSDVLDTTNDLILRLDVDSMATPEVTGAYSMTVGVAPAIAITNVTSLIEPGDINASSMYVRMEARGNNLQMPPKGSATADTAFLAVFEAWINGLPAN